MLTFDGRHLPGFHRVSCWQLACLASIGVSAGCAPPTSRTPGVGPNATPSPGRELADTSVEYENDSTRWLVVKNPNDRSIRVFEVSVYNCVNVRTGCGTFTHPIDIAPHQSARVQTVRRPSWVGDWQWSYLVRARWTPPTDAFVYEATVPSGAGGLMAAEMALSWDSYHPTGRSRALQPYEAINVARHITLFVEENSGSGGFATIYVSGEVYKGDTTGGRVGARPADWWPITRSDSGAAAIVRQMGDRIGAIMTMHFQELRDSVLRRGPAGTVATGGMQLGPNQMGTSESSARVAKDLGGGRLLSCRANGPAPEAPFVVDLTTSSDCPTLDAAVQMHYNAYIAVRTASLRVGTRVETCGAYTRDVPGGWDRIEWHRDSTRCAVDGVGIDSTQPNVLVVQRVR